jgi:hypothetical protein
VIDPALRPEGWSPKPGSRVVVLPETKAAADVPPPPPGVWVVIDRAPEATAWWVQPADGESRAWAVASMAGRPRQAWPTGWPCQAIGSRRLFPAALVQKVLPGC